jgi:glutaminase
VCTIDGQQLNLGDTKTDFCIQSCSKPITYGLALEIAGENIVVFFPGVCKLISSQVHQHVGREPSGRGFNAYKLNHTGLPFNPLINSGAIATAALISPKTSMADVSENSFILLLNFHEAF